MANITTAQAGNFSSTSTWTGGVVPGSSDTIAINHAQTWDTSFTVAGATINASVVTSGTGRTFTFSGNVTQANTTAHVNVTIGAGNNVAGVQGSPFVWTVGNMYSPGSDTWLKFNGSTGSHCAVSDCRLTGDGVNTGTGVVKATYTDFLRCGDATHNALAPNEQSWSNPFTIYDCTFDTCGQVGNPNSLIGTDTFDIRRCVWKNSTNPYCLFVSIYGAIAAGGVRNVVDCVFDKGVKLFTPRDLTFTGNFCNLGYATTVGKWAAFSNNYCRTNVSASGIGFIQLGDITNCYFYVDFNGPNPHPVGPDSSMTDLLFDGNIFDVLASDGQGDCYSGIQPTSASTYTLTRNIVLPGRDGNGVGVLFTLGGNLNPTLIANHNTVYSASQAGAAYGENSPGYTGEIASYRGNLIYSPTPNTGIKLWDSGHTGSSTGIIQDEVLPANADYNGGFNTRSTIVSAPAWYTNQGNGYAGKFSSTPGVHDINGQDPQFFDGTRNSGTWDISLGGDGTSAHILAQFQARNASYTVPNLMTYVKNGFAPQNQVYKNASYPGDALMADIGAVAVTAPAAPTTYTLTGPASGLVNTASTNFTVTLGAGVIVSPVTITPSSGGGGGTFSPTSVTLGNSTRSLTFTYTPASTGVKTISCTDNQTLIDPAPISYSVVSGGGPTTYTVTSPSVIDIGIPRSFSVTLNVPADTTITVTPSAAHGTFSPTAMTINAGGSSASFTYAPAQKGAVSISFTNNAAMTDPAPISYTVTPYGSNLVTWQNAMSGSYWKNDFGAHLSQPAPLGFTGGELHYDPILVFEMMYKYNGNDATFLPDIAAALWQVRDIYIFSNSGQINAYENFTAGLRENYFRTGDNRSREALILNSINGVITNEQVSATYGTNIAYSREVAFGIQSLLDAEDAGCSHRSRLDTFVNLALGHLDQWSVAENLRPTCWFMQPFMTGLTIRSLIAYWDKYRDTTITGIPAKIKSFLDYLWTGSHSGINYWFPTGGNTTGTGAFGYFYPDDRTLIGCPGDAGTGNQGGPIPVGELNPIIAPGYYWYFQYSGDDTYRQRGDDIFAGSTVCVPQIAPTNPLYSQKVYNQSYFYMWRGVNWRARGITAPATETALTLTGPGTTGVANLFSDNFKVSFAGTNTKTTNAVVVTPGSNAGGRFIPATITLTADHPVGVFKFAPATAGTASISITNNGSLTNPAPISYVSSGSVPLATDYTVSVPGNANNSTSYSPPFVLSLSPANSVPPVSADANGGLVKIGSSDSFAGGAVNPVTGPWFTPTTTTTSMTYIPRSSTPVTRNVIFGAAAYLPTAIKSVSYSTLTYTISGTATGTVGIPVNLSVNTNVPTGTQFTLTPSDGGKGGVFSPTSLTLNVGDSSAVFTYVPAQQGTITIGCTNTYSLPNTSQFSIAVSLPIIPVSPTTPIIVNSVGTTTVSLTATDTFNMTAPLTYKWYRFLQLDLAPTSRFLVGTGSTLNDNVSPGTTYYYLYGITDANGITNFSTTVEVDTLPIVSPDFDPVVDTSVDTGQKPVHGFMFGGGTTQFLQF